MLQRFAIAELPSTPWKNGGGSTREVVSWPPGAGFEGFDWRVSIATIDASGPFSPFPGVDRTIMLLEGDGVLLQSEGFEHWLDKPHEPFAFSGDVLVDCALLGGDEVRPSTDFNVMSRRARGSVEVWVLEYETRLPRDSHGLLLTIDGQWRVGGGMLTQGRGVWWADQPEQWHVKPASRGAKLASVRWLPAGEI